MDRGARKQAERVEQKAKRAASERKRKESSRGLIALIDER